MSQEVSKSQPHIVLIIHEQGSLGTLLVFRCIVGRKNFVHKKRNNSFLFRGLTEQNVHYSRFEERKKYLWNQTRLGICWTKAARTLRGDVSLCCQEESGCPTLGIQAGERSHRPGPTSPAGRWRLKTHFLCKTGRDYTGPVPGQDKVSR